MHNRTVAAAKLPGLIEKLKLVLSKPIVAERVWEPPGPGRDERSDLGLVKSLAQADTESFGGLRPIIPLLSQFASASFA
jgi:hypothetical protein